VRRGFESPAGFDGLWKVEIRGGVKAVRVQDDLRVHELKLPEIGVPTVCRVLLSPVLFLLDSRIRFV
jgi:hypothetical protein